MIATLRLARGLLVAADPAAATRLVAKFCVERFGVPVAAWAAGSDPHHLELVELGAMEPGQAKSLHEQMQRLPRFGDLSPAAQGRVRERFSSLVGAASADVLDAGHALVMVADGNAGPERDLRGLQELLGDVLHERAEVEPPQPRISSFDLSLALTAHELRGPLLTSRAAVEGVAVSPDISGRNRRTLKGAANVLTELARSVDAILHWAAGAAALRIRRIDLSKVVRQTVRETTRDDRSRLLVRSKDAVLVKGDPRHLRVAIGNLIRNALEHTPEDESVKVDVARRDGFATVTVTDRGPGVSASERTSIFDPFVTGSRPGGDGRGRGLGLFITRRVAEAHGGRVWVESSGRGARFCMSLPQEEAPR